MGHEHFLAGFYRWDGAKWQLHLVQWDPESDPGISHEEVRYSNCAFCSPETKAQG